MSKRILLCIFLWIPVAILNKSEAQFADDQYMFGCGFSYSFLNSKEFESNGRPGFNSTFGCQYDISQKFGMHAYFDYSNMGAKIDAFEYDINDQVFTPTQVKFFYSYIMVGCLATYNIIEPLSVHVGGCFGSKFRSGKDLKSENLYINNSDFSGNINLNTVFDKMAQDYGLVSGISVGNEDVEFWINYVYYFKNVFADYSVPVTSHNSVIELKLLMSLSQF